MAIKLFKKNVLLEKVSALEKDVNDLKITVAEMRHPAKYKILDVVEFYAAPIYSTRIETGTINDVSFIKKTDPYMGEGYTREYDIIIHGRENKPFAKNLTVNEGAIIKLIKRED